MSEQIENIKFIQQNSPDGGFLQSWAWRKFQESVGRKTFQVATDGFSANIVNHSLPLVGDYFYVPRGPVTSLEGEEFSIKQGMLELIRLAKKENAGWIRIEPANAKILEAIKESLSEKVVKAPHDVQPKEILLLKLDK